MEDYLPVYNFTGNKQTKLKFKIKNNQIVVPGSTGVSKFSISEKVWTTNKTKCKDIKGWNEANFGPLSKITPNNDELVIDLFTENNHGTMINMTAGDIVPDTPNN